MNEKHETPSAQALGGQDATRNHAAGATKTHGHDKWADDPDKRRADKTGSTSGSAADAAQAAYEQGQRYYQQGARAARRQTAEAPLLSLLVVGAVGYVLAWAIHGAQRGTWRATDRTRTRRDYPGQRSGKPLIESDRVEGTAVYDPAGQQIGTIKRVMIEKISGRVAYAVMSFGRFLGIGTDEYAIPWSKLEYDTSLEGYRTNITEEQLRNAPGFSRDRDQDWSDQQREQELHDYYQVTYYWLVQ